MANWLQKMLGKLQPMHPPWQAGQYVTYILEYDDGWWIAFLLHLLGKDDEGAWVLCGDFKTPLGELTVWFRCDPNAPSDTMDIAPVRGEVIRKSIVEEDDPRRFNQEPMVMAPLAINILQVRRVPTAKESFQRPPTFRRLSLRDQPCLSLYGAGTRIHEAS